jgi:hypothetical protein
MTVTLQAALQRFKPEDYTLVPRPSIKGEELLTLAISLPSVIETLPT